MKAVDSQDTTLTVSPIFVMLDRWSAPRTKQQEEAIWESTPYAPPWHQGWPVPQYTIFGRKSDGLAAILVEYCNGVSALLSAQGLVVYHTTHEDLLATWMTDADTSGFGTPPNPGVTADFGTPPNPG